MLPTEAQALQDQGQVAAWVHTDRDPRHPGKVVARTHASTHEGGHPLTFVLVADTLTALRAQRPAGVSCRNTLPFSMRPGVIELWDRPWTPPNGPGSLSCICNLYRFMAGQAAVRAVSRVVVDRSGNLPPLPGIVPEQMASVVRNGGDGRERAVLRWGFPSPLNVPRNPAGDEHPQHGIALPARLDEAGTSMPHSRDLIL